MRAIIRLKHGERMPRGYGVAYLAWDYDRIDERGVAAWLGLHLVLRLAHRVWEAIYRYVPSGLERERAMLRSREWRLGEELKDSKARIVAIQATLKQEGENARESMGQTARALAMAVERRKAVRRVGGELKDANAKYAAMTECHETARLRLATENHRLKAALGKLAAAEAVDAHGPFMKLIASELKRHAKADKSGGKMTTKTPSDVDICCAKLAVQIYKALNRRLTDDRTWIKYFGRCRGAGDSIEMVGFAHNRVTLPHRMLLMGRVLPAVMPIAMADDYVQGWAEKTARECAKRIMAEHPGRWRTFAAVVRPTGRGSRIDIIYGVEEVAVETAALSGRT